MCACVWISIYTHFYFAFLFSFKIRKLFSSDQHLSGHTPVPSVFLRYEWRLGQPSAMWCSVLFSGPACVGLSSWKCLKSQNDGLTSYLRPEAQWHDGVLESGVCVHMRRDAWKNIRTRVKAVQPVKKNELSLEFLSFKQSVAFLMNPPNLLYVWKAFKFRCLMVKHT